MRVGRSAADRARRQLCDQGLGARPALHVLGRARHPPLRPGLRLREGRLQGGDPAVGHARLLYRACVSHLLSCISVALIAAAAAAAVVVSAIDPPESIGTCGFGSIVL